MSTVLRQKHWMPFMNHGLHILIGAIAVFTASATPAKARAETLKFHETRFVGLYLGMTADEFENLVASRTDFGELRVQAFEVGFDCDALLNPAAEADRAKASSRHFPSPFYFDDAARNEYLVHFVTVPTHSFIGDITITERKSPASWGEHLAAAEARFGKANIVGRANGDTMAAKWCMPEQLSCRIEEYGDLPELTLSFHPWVDNGLNPDDRLEFRLAEGRSRHHRHVDEMNRLKAEASARTKAQYRQCQAGIGAFKDVEQASRYYTALAPITRGASKPIWSSEQVPAAAFLALGIDPATDLAPGTCFWPGGVLIESMFPKCKRFTAKGFRWARRIGDIWLLAPQRPIRSREPRYVAVRGDSQGQLHKIWWAYTTASFDTWYAGGAMPMIESVADRTGVR
ncbi:MAG: hypothetical protein ACREBX_03025 [Sphingopyxis sp.]